MNRPYPAFPPSQQGAPEPQWQASVVGDIPPGVSPHPYAMAPLGAGPLPTPPHMAGEMLPGPPLGLPVAVDAASAVPILLPPPAAVPVVGPAVPGPLPEMPMHDPFLDMFHGLGDRYYLATNPPVFEPGVMDGTEYPRRRRVSISNGQIGQILELLHANYTQPATPVEVPVEFKSGIKKEDDAEGLQVNNNGVPQHQLFYGNEMIFNPHGGPIRGTAAWKRARLLERNRVAASKCRQRKKTAQELLERNADILLEENSRLQTRVTRLQGIVDKYQKMFKDHMATCSLEQNSGLLDMLEELVKMEKELAMKSTRSPE